MGESRSGLISRRTVITAVIIGAAWLVTRDVVQSYRKQQARAVVRELGGRMGGLPAWPFGEEIRITFDGRDFSPLELQKLTVLNPLARRNWVGVAFVDTNLTRDDILELRTVLPKCVVFRVVDGATIRDE